MDKTIWGGNYRGHFGPAAKCDVQTVETQKDHPILKGMKPFASAGSLYKNPELAKDATVLLRGSIPDHSEPIAWIRDLKGRRIFYTSLGHPEDFKNPHFVGMLTNAIFWTTKTEMPQR